jgi:hypothetical protein
MSPFPRLTPPGGAATRPGSTPGVVSRKPPALLVFRARAEEHR